MHINEFIFDEITKKDNKVLNILLIETFFKLVTSTFLMMYFVYTGKSEQFKMECTHAEIFLIISIIGCVSYHGLETGIKNKLTLPLIAWIFYEIVSIGYLLFFITDRIIITANYSDIIHLFVLGIVALDVAVICLVIELFSIYFACCMFQIASDHEVYFEPCEDT
ncbi:hypothetical protein ACKWTF_002661 [Chironomus riparius]